MTRPNRKRNLLNGLDLKVLTPLYPRVLSYINMEGGRNVEMFRVKNKFLTREPEILILFMSIFSFLWDKTVKAASWNDRSDP